MNQKLSIISCIAKNRGIGLNNQLIYRIPADLEYFKKLTLGHVLLMGQKTYQSIGKALPGRTTIVVSNDPNFKTPDAKVAHSLDEALHLAKELEKVEVFVCGGGSIYAQTISLADKLYLTLVEDEPKADTYFPDYQAFSKVIWESPEESYQGLKFKFIELEKGES